MTTVLIIEDNQDHRVLIERILIMIDLDALVANDDQDLDYFLNRVDMVILDMNLSQRWSMNSFEIINYIRNHCSFMTLPILALTSIRINIDPIDRIGWNILLMKPFDVSDLKNSIKHLIG